ncbi:MAG: type IV toxin-antitoxin system AbiEi family antitoxin domain-containing protein [Candidatus Omnitrophica bacterium]|nr:type IV toxin-antitoxin system AbiEi family antitoxin domain-containing protein [Candidatus Omnitrophota bacterium]MBU2222092.1 type IV toxin-antitoxin system AbiEi family antitoxin domain-containing protein [Candidatus Omnitrophota bacterium]
MNYTKIRQLNKLYFNYRDISRAFRISLGSSRVAATRLVKSGDLTRIKRNFYVLSQKWNSSSLEERFILANLIQVPSYISLMTALSYYEVTTQVQRDFIESVVYYRTKLVEVMDSSFNYSKINRKLYFGFVKLKGFFIATAEKAFLDAFYLKSLRKYNFDITSVDFNKLNMKLIVSMAGKYPLLTRKLLLKYGYLKKA